MAKDWAMRLKTVISMTWNEVYGRKKLIFEGMWCSMFVSLPVYLFESFI